MSPKTGAPDTASEKIKRPRDNSLPHDDGAGVDDPFVTFNEWANEADEDAYSRL